MVREEGGSEGQWTGGGVRVMMVRVRTFKKASLTLSSLIMPLRHRFATSSALDVPELRHAMLVSVIVLGVLLDSDGCLC